MLTRMNNVLFVLCVLFLLTGYASNADDNLAEKVKNDLHEYNDYIESRGKASQNGE